MDFRVLLNLPQTKLSLLLGVHFHNGHYVWWMSCPSGLA